MTGLDRCHPSLPLLRLPAAFPIEMQNNHQQTEVNKAYVPVDVVLRPVRMRLTIYANGLIHESFCDTTNRTYISLKVVYRLTMNNLL